MSLRALAAERDVDERTLMNHSASDGWDAARTAHRIASAAKVAKVAVEWRAKTESEIHRIGHNIVLDMLAGAEKMAQAMREGSMRPADTKAAIESVKAMIATARTTAGLPEVPVPVPAESPLDGEIILRRRRADGSETEVHLGGTPSATP